MINPRQIASDGYLTGAVKRTLVIAIAGWINGVVGVPLPDSVYLTFPTGENDLTFARSDNRVVFDPSKNDFTLGDE